MNKTHGLKPCLVLILLCLLSACSRQPQLQPLAPDARILAFGDSLTYGTGAKREQSYPAQLSQLLSREVINAGIPGEISSAGLTRLPALLEEYDPDLVIICHGGNDLLRRLGNDQAAANIQQMIDLSRQHGAQVVLIGVPELGIFLASAAFYSELAEANAIVIENNVLGDILARTSLKSDQIHPNAAGYRIFAERIAALLQSTGGV